MELVANLLNLHLPCLFNEGKTTLLQHILTSDHQGKKYAVIVNDMNEVNIDGSLVQPFISHQKETMVEMSNGCICCTLRDDLLKEVSRIAKEHKYDHLIIESTGIGEPMPVAETFTFSTTADSHNDDDDDDSHDEEIDFSFVSSTNQKNTSTELLMDIAEIDSMVTVIDAVNFLHDIKAAEDLSARNLQADESDCRTITDLLVSQVEFATVLIVNKCDLISKEQLLEVKKMIRALNADAKIIESVRSKVNINEIIGARGFDFDKVSQSPTWIRAINDNSDKM
jgi:G3E family GTPase